MQSRGYWTPRYVWSASVLATTLLHVGGIWWVKTQWSRSPDMPPAPIEVIAVPSSESAAASPTPPEPEPVPQSPQSLPPPPLSNSTPTPATSNSSSTTSESTANSGPSTPPVSTEPTAPTPNPQPNPAPGNTSPTNPSPPNTPSPSDPVVPPAGGEAPPNLQQGLLVIDLSLEPIPNSGIDSDKLYDIHGDWREQAFAPGDIACSLSPVDTSSSFQVTVQLTIKNGSITDVEPSSNSRDRVYDSLAVCLIKNSLPVLVPASPDVGVPPDLYKALLRLDGKFEP